MHMRFVFVFFVTFLFVSIFPVSLFVPTLEAQGGGWMEGWQYRISHVTNSASGAGTDYQVRIKARWGELIQEDLVPSSEIVSTLPIPTEASIISAQAAVYWDGTYLHVWYGATTGGDINDAIYYTKASSPFTSWSTPVKVMDRDDGIRDPTILIEGDNLYLFCQCWDGELYRPIRLYKINRNANYTDPDNYVYVGVVVDVSAGTCDENMAASSCVVNIGGTYYLMYEAFSSDWKGSIGRAKSTNIESLPWTKDGQLKDTNGNVIYNPSGNFALVPDTFADEDTLFVHYWDGSNWRERYINGDFANNSATLSDVDINPYDNYSNHADIAHIGDFDETYYFLMQSWNSDTMYLRLYASTSYIGDTVALHGHSRTDFGDVRFTRSDGVTLLDYWMESKVDGDYAVFWVEVADDLSSQARTIYIYYGKNDANTTSNGDNTFLLFDDFLDSSLDSNKWTSVIRGNGGSVSVANSEVALNPNDNTISSTSIQSVATFTNDILIRIKRKYTGGTEDYLDTSLGAGNVVDESGNQNNWWCTALQSGYVWVYHSAYGGYSGLRRMPTSGGYVELSTSSKDLFDTTYKIHDLGYTSNGVLKWIVDGTQQYRVTDSNFLNNNKKILISQGEFLNGQGANTLIDYVFIRKYVDPEPAHGQSGIQETKDSSESSVYYKEDATYMHVYHPHLYVRIVKPRGNWQPGGRIDTIMFKGNSIVKTDDPKFGTISVLNATDLTQTQWMYPDTMSLVSAVGNDTNKLVLELATSSITLFDGTGALPVNVTVEYTLYADIDNIFIWVTLDSSLTAWRLDSTIYGQSLSLSYFQNYEVKGTRNTVIGQGSLTGTTSQDFVFTATHAQVTVKNTTNNVAVTMIPLGLFPPIVWIRDGSAWDGTGSTWIFFETVGSTTWDGSWYEWGQNIRNITYGTGIALHDADVLPQVVTPWLMPNAVPYGIMHSYDELPNDSHNKIQPDPTTNTYTYWYWHEQNPEVKINLMLGLDMLTGDYTPTEEGVDRSWEVHGDTRLADASTEWKNWLKGIEGTWIGYGIHACHHDYPWEWEFSTVTNVTWIDATWNQIIEDVRAIGLKDQTWFKGAGYRMRPQGLDILIKYGIKGYNVNYDEPPTVTARGFHVDPDGRKLILFSNSLCLDYELNEGKTPSYIYNNLIKGNLTKLGLLSMSGHFIDQSIYPKWEELFDSISAEFDVHYFLVEEIVDYWYNALLPLKYTYNSTTITKNVDDSRLTFRLINSTILTSSGYRYDDETFTLYSPDMETPTFPIYSNVGTNTTKAGAVCQFYSKWTSNENMSGYIFATNNTGIWRNDTWTAWNPPQTPAWSNVTKTLDSAVGMIVGYRFYANDTSNNWSDTGIRTITLTDDNAYIFSDGFESGSFARWDLTAGAPEVVSTTSHHGTYSLKADAEWDYAAKQGLSQSDTIYVRGYFTFSALPNDGQYVLPLLCRNLEGTILCGLELKNEGGTQKIVLWDMVAWEGSEYVATLDVNRWYSFEIKYYKHSTAGELRLYIDGVECGTLLNRQFNDQVDKINIGWVWGDYAGIIYADCLVVSDTYIGI